MIVGDRTTLHTRFRRRLAILCAAAVLFGEAAVIAEPVQADPRPAASEALLVQGPDELVARVYRRSRRGRVYARRYVLVRKRICRRSRWTGARRCRVYYVRRLRRPRAAVLRRAPVYRAAPPYVVRPPVYRQPPVVFAPRMRSPAPSPQTFGARTGGSQKFFYCVGPRCPRR